MPGGAARLDQAASENANPADAILDLLSESEAPGKSAVKYNRQLRPDQSACINAAVARRTPAGALIRSTLSGLINPSASFHSAESGKPL